MNIQWKTGRALLFSSDFFGIRNEIYYSRKHADAKNEEASARLSRRLSLIRKYLFDRSAISSAVVADDADTDTRIYVLTRAGYLRVSVNLSVRARARARTGTQRRHPSNCLENSPDALRTRTVRTEFSVAISSVSSYRGGFAARDGSIERRKWSWRLLLDRFARVCHPCHAK